MVDRNRFGVPWRNLRVVCDPANFTFQGTSQVPPVQEFIGQERAIEALRQGLDIEVSGYNIFVTGAIGTGRNATIGEFLERYVREKETQGKYRIFDLCYVHNFRNPSQPQLLVLEKGGGKKFQIKMEEVLAQLQKETPAFFQSEEHQKQATALQEEFRAKNDEMMKSVDKLAGEKKLVMVQYPNGHAAWHPMSLLDPRKPISPDEQKSLSEDLRQIIDANVKEFNEFLRKIRAELLQFKKGIERRIDSLEKKGIARVVDGVFKSIEYRDLPEVKKFLKGLKGYIIRHIDLFMPQENQHPNMMMIPQFQSEEDPFLAFRVNVFVDNSETRGAPVIFENHPTFSNLFGRIERKPVHGTYVTDHAKIKPGSFLRANGGYLVINNIIDLLVNPGVWQKLKRTLKTGRFKFEEALEHIGLFAPEGLDPEEIPVTTKIIVLGSPDFYSILSLYDEDFRSCFKIKAEFDSQMERTSEHQQDYAGFVAFCCQKENLLPFDPTGVAKIVEYGMRLASHQKKLSTLFGLIKNLIVEANYFARQSESPLATEKHVKKALEAKRKRDGLTEEKIQKLIQEGTILVDVKGEKVGQVNGLAVSGIGEFLFGRPSRITAQCFLGKGELINIEREAKLSGQVFDKAAYILKSHLGSRYSQEIPLAVSISLAFEQSYGPIEGDSASIAELAAVVSSLSRLAADQGLALTGSMNQLGDVQAVGGINEKIEGHFDVCRILGLTGKQGVIIPQTNVQHLMLREDVVEACKNGQFHVFAVEKTEEALELILGKEIDEIDRLVKERLQKMAETIKRNHKNNLFRKIFEALRT